jgi:hypothetical protein
MPQYNSAYTARSAAGPPAYQNLGKGGDLLTGSLYGTYYEGVYSGSAGFGGNTAGVTTSAGLATTYVGCCLSNPAASGKNLVVNRVSGSLIVDPATITTIFLAVGWVFAGLTAHTTPLTPLNAKIGTLATGLVGNLDSACTLVGTPAYRGTLGQSTSAILAPSFNVDIGGGVVIPPGGWCATATNIAGPASGFMGFFEWLEVAP